MSVANIDNVGGGIVPEGTKSITENGTYDVTDFASADVNVNFNSFTSRLSYTVPSESTTSTSMSAEKNAIYAVTICNGSSSQGASLSFSGANVLYSGGQNGKAFSGEWGGWIRMYVIKATSTTVSMTFRQKSSDIQAVRIG